MPDIHVELHGSIALVRPLTPAAVEWLADHVSIESWQWFAGGLAVEPRYLADLLVGAINDGLQLDEA